MKPYSITVGESSFLIYAEDVHAAIAKFEADWFPLIKAKSFSIVELLVAESKP